MSKQELPTAEPFATRKSDVYGVVDLYAPPGDPSSWSSEPWCLVTEHGNLRLQDRHIAHPDKAGPGFRILVRADRAHDAFIRPGILTSADLYVDQSAEVEIELAL